MEIKYINPLWGIDGSLDSQFAKIANAGYDGIESAPRKKEHHGPSMKPFTTQPVSSIWDISLWKKVLLKEKYQILN